MSYTDNVPVPGPLQRPLRRLAGAIAARFRGPGGYYNAGNLLGLATALGLQLAAAASSQRSGADTVFAFFAGSERSVALTAATVIFLISGEVYHRAWRKGAAPDRQLNRLADVLSAAGGAALSISLLYLGQPLLAVSVGLLTVLGKLGSAVFGDDPAALPSWPASWPDPFRSAVLAGRVPAVAVVGLDLAHQIGSGAPAAALIHPVILIACHLLWIKADLLLLYGGRTLAAAPQA